MLLFSNSVRLLHILRSLVTAKGYDYVMLDGSTPREVSGLAACGRRGWVHRPAQPAVHARSPPGHPPTRSCLHLPHFPPLQERQQLCDRFNSQPSTFLFLISTLAGGTGLNLTSANKVIIMDPRQEHPTSSPLPASACMLGPLDPCLLAGPPSVLPLPSCRPTHHLLLRAAPATLCSWNPASDLRESRARTVERWLRHC